MLARRHRLHTTGQRLGAAMTEIFYSTGSELEAHNLSSLPAKIVVDFHFVGQPENQPEPRKLFSRRTFDVDVPPGYQKRVSLRSDVLKSNETRYVMLGEQYNSGYHITGWLLQASVPNEATPFASVSSNPAWIAAPRIFQSGRRCVETSGDITENAFTVSARICRVLSSINVRQCLTQ